MEKRIFVGSDHAGFQVKNELREYMEEQGYNVTDLGCFSEDPCDYPDIAREVGEKVQEHKDSVGMLVCGSGVGISIAANKLRGIRCALLYKPELAETARKHNNANVMALGARFTEMSDMKAVVDKFLTTDFEGDAERHARRVDKLNTM